MNGRLHVVVFMSIVVTGILLRFAFLYLSPYAFINEDSSTIGLMARHILKGDIPMFFYGQYYQAPIEPLLVSLCFLIFGINSITLSIAPIFLTCLLLLVTYLLGREFKNATVGFWAMMYFFLSPYYLYHDSITPLGYHIEILLIGEIILLLTLKISKTAKKLRLYILLGLVSGIGFWMSYLLIYFIIASGVYMFLTERKSSLIKNGIFCALCFFLSGLPYWIFSIKHRFITFAFPGGEHVSGLDVLKKFSTFDIHGLLGDTYLGFIYLFALIVFVIHTIRVRDKRLLLLWLFFLSAIILYTRGRYHAMAAIYHYRYISSIYVFIALMLGYFTWLLNKKTIFLGSFIMILLLGVHSMDIYRNLARERGHSNTVKSEYENLSKFLLSNVITRIVGPDRSFRPLMFLSDENLICQEYMGSGYLGYDDIVEESPRTAFFTDIDFTSSLNSLCKGFKKERNFYYDFRPYPYSFKEIPDNLWNGSTKHNLRDVRFAFDRNYDTLWSTKKPKTPSMYFYLDLGRVYKVSKIQFFYANHYKNLPRICKVDVSQDNKIWEEVMVVSNPQPFFWSGPRIYWHLPEGRWEMIFEPRDARYIRFTEMGSEEGNPWEINEIFVYEYKGKADYKEDLKRLKQAYRFLKQKGADFIYADYWESAKIRQWGGVGALRPFNALYFWLTDAVRQVKWDRYNAFILKEENIEGWEKLFNTAMNKRQFGRYFCYYDPVRGSPRRASNGVYWIGVSGVKTGLRENYIHPLPKNKVSLEFKNGVRFLGYTIHNKRIFPGKEMLIDYFWESRKKPKGDLSVFVHFVKDGKIIFQNDHSFLYKHKKIRERLRLKIPADIPAGEYNIIIGLWLKDKNKRICIKGLEKSSVEIGKLEVKYP